MQKLTSAPTIGERPGGDGLQMRDAIGGCGAVPARHITRQTQSADVAFSAT